MTKEEFSEISYRLDAENKGKDEKEKTYICHNCGKTHKIDKYINEEYSKRFCSSCAMFFFAADMGII